MESGLDCGPAGHDLEGLRFVFPAYFWVPYRSGLTADSTRIAEALSGCGAHVTAIVGRHEPSLPKVETVRGVEVRRLPVLLRYDRTIIVPGLVPAFARAARSAHVAVLTLPIAEAGALARVAPRGGLAANYICDPSLPGRRLGAPLMRLVDMSARHALRRADLIRSLSLDYAAHSRVLRDFLPRTIAIPPIVTYERMRHLDGAADIDRFGGAGRIRVGYLGRLVHEKGLDRLVRAAAELDSGVRLVLAGDSDKVAGGGERERLADLAAALGIDLVFTGPLPDADIPAFLGSLDVFALPSVDPLEAWGIVQAEAMLCGTPVVASALPGVRELVAQTGMGITVTPGDTRALAQAIERVACDRERFVIPRDDVIRSLGLDTVRDRHVEALATLAKRVAAKRS